MELLRVWSMSVAGRYAQEALREGVTYDRHSQISGK